MNLIGNAIKYTAEGEVTVNVKWETDESSNERIVEYITP